MKKKRLKIKNVSSWVTLIVFIVLTGMLYTGMGLMIRSFVSIALGSRMDEALLNVLEMADEYESEDYADGQLSVYGVSYYITDSSGNVLKTYGEITRSDSGIAYESDTFPDRNFMIYMDTKETIVIPTESGSLSLDFSSFIEVVNDIISNGHAEEILFPGNESSSYSPFVDFPLWISINVKNGSEILYVRGMLGFNVRDLMVLVEIFIMMMIIFLGIFIALLINAIKTFAINKKFRKVYYTDRITGGYNWEWFALKSVQLLGKRASDEKRYAVVSFEFVKYLYFCVCHSVAQGEELLNEIYRTAASGLEKDELCAHIGQQNFAFLLQMEDESSLESRLRDIMGSLSDISMEHKLNFHAGVFIIEHVRDETGRFERRKDYDIESAYNNALAARTVLDGNDESGISFFDDKIIEEQKWIDTVNERQQAALDNEEFIVYYQPKYDPRTDELRGAEALIRWQSPEFGFVTPYKFIPIFENNGFIKEIDHYMLKHVAADQRKWLDMGYKCVKVSVNVSRAHFIESDLAEQIRDIVDKAGTPRELIEIEVTESAFFDDKKAMIETINKLKAYGFSVSMDDFGSGYSSLNSLKDMPLDVLKLDAEFFRGEELCTDRGKIVVSEAIRLAKSLNMRTVAEGVEEEEQVKFLAGQGCDMIQGYYYAKPMPVEDFEGRMSRKGKRFGTEESRQ